MKEKINRGAIKGDFLFLKYNFRKVTASLFHFMHFKKGGYFVLYTILANYAREEILTILNKWYIITENKLIKGRFYERSKYRRT